jgi:UDP-N-acetylenolpyruvoylglucosamine reductase
VSDKNALVLISDGNASFEDLMKAEQKIIDKVKEKFDVTLVREPIIIS